MFVLAKICFLLPIIKDKYVSAKFKKIYKNAVKNNDLNTSLLWLFLNSDLQSFWRKNILVDVLWR